MATTLQTYKDGAKVLMVTNDMDQHFTDAKWNQWANWAGERVIAHADWDWMKKAVEFASEEDQEWYDLDDTKIRLDGVFRVTSGPKATEKNHDIVKFDRYQEEKSDKSLYLSSVLGRQVFYSPEATVGDPIGLYGKRQWETLVSNTDVSIIPSSYDEAVIQYMVMYAHNDSMNPEEADKAERRAKDFLDRKLVVSANDQPAGFDGVVPNNRFTT